MNHESMIASKRKGMGVCACVWSFCSLCMVKWMVDNTFSIWMAMID